MTNLSGGRLRPHHSRSANTSRGSFLQRKIWPTTNKLLATGVLLAYSPIGVRLVAPAIAQEIAEPPPNSSATAQATGPWRFDISPGPLGEVLAEIESATLLRIEIGTPGLRDVQSPGVQGVYPARAALQQALRGTAARFVFEFDKAVRVELDPISVQIEVVADAILSAPTYTAPLRDTPQTVTVIGQPTIESQGATTLRDVLRNVTGLTVSAGEGGAPAGDNLTLRGFSARNDIFIDGTRDLGPQARDPFNVEQVEVVKGPQSTFTGRGSAGGSINMSSKTARLDRFVNVSTLFGTDRTKRGVVDLNAPIGLLVDRTAFRLNLMGHDSGVAGRDVVNYRRWGVAPTLSLGLGSPTRWTLGYAKLTQDNLSDYGIPWVPGNHNVLSEFRNQPAPVPRNTFYGFRNRDREEMGSDATTVRFEHDFSDNLNIRNQFRYGRSTRDSIATPPRFNNPDTTEIKREMRSWITEDDIYDNRADLTASFETGSVEHTVVTGFSLTREENIRRYRSAPTQLTTLFNPDPDEAYLGDFSLSPLTADIAGDTQSAYAFDTVRLARRWQATGGARIDRFTAAGNAVGWTRLPTGWVQVPAPVEQTDTMLSLRGGLVFNPADSGSLYVSYGSSLNPSIEGLTYGFRTSYLGLEPEKTYTVEGGSKWNLFNDRLLVTGAVFDVRKTNARTSGLLPDDPPTVLEGTQRIRGVEFGATGHVTPSWMVFSGYAFLDNSIVELNNPSQIGNRFLQTPDHNFNLWTTYELPRSVTVGGGVRHVGERFNGVSNARRVDGYWTLDLMAEFPVHDRLHVRLNAFNLTNEYYFDRVGGGHIIPRPARSLMAGLNFRF